MYYTIYIYIYYIYVYIYIYSNSILSDEKLKAFRPRSGIRFPLETIKLLEENILSKLDIDLSNIFLDIPRQEKQKQN